MRPMTPAERIISPWCSRGCAARRLRRGRGGHSGAREARPGTRRAESTVRRHERQAAMGKLVVSLDGVVIKEVQITKDKTTLGRRPYNDIVIDNLAVSGEHAVLQMVGSDVFIEDLNSTNGTYINGKAVKKQLLAHNDTVEVGKYKIKYMVEDGTDYEKTMIMKPGAMTASGSGRASGFGGLAGATGGNIGPATIRVMNGAAAG